MANISVHLLGRPYVEVDGERVNFPYKKAEGFFYYLCVKKTATREHIIDKSESHGGEIMQYAIELYYDEDTENK